jgi:membrane fusion protein (multidrug efflux system)
MRPRVGWRTRVAGLALAALAGLAGTPVSAQGPAGGARPASGSPAAGGAAADASADVDTPAAAPVRVLLIPARETTIVAQMGGRVGRLGGELGASFKADASLVEFECGEQKARLKIAEAEHDAARQQHETKLRLQGLNAAGESEVQLAATAVARAAAQIDLAVLQAAHCRIDAPFSGRIVKLHVRPFQGVSAGQPLIDIVSGGPLKLRLNAPSKWLSWLRPGTRFQVRIDETGRLYPATVSAINGRVDAVSQSIEVEGTIRGTYPELLAGMSGNAVFPRGR